MALADGGSLSDSVNANRLKPIVGSRVHEQFCGPLAVVQ